MHRNPKPFSLQENPQYFMNVGKVRICMQTRQWFQIPPSYEIESKHVHLSCIESEESKHLPIFIKKSQGAKK